MSATTFNAITYANKLKKAGLEGKIADVEAEEMSNLVNNDLVTKTFLASEIKSLEYRMIIKVGFMMVVQSTLFLTIIGLLMKK